MTKDLNLKNFRMPGEWEPQKSVWIAWPYNKKDWPGMFKNIPKTIAEIITNLSLNQKVNLLINKRKDKIKIKKILKKFKYKLKNITFHIISTDRIWLRDTGPIFLINKKKKVFLNFKFNAWAKYRDFKKDNKINDKIAKILKVKKIEPEVKIQKKYKKIVLEGGAIDVDGNGTILLTRECLLSKVQNRNPGVTKKVFENTIKTYLNIKNFIWLNKGIKGDDTPIEPGEWKDVDVPSGSIRENIMPLPYKEPSQTLLALLNQITTEGRRLGAISDMDISDMSANAPVGTTLALLERTHADVWVHNDPCLL